MKRLICSICAALLFVAAAQNASAQTEETRQVSGFNSIGSAGPFNVHVKIDGTESLRIKADKAVISQIETVVENGKLQIRPKHRDHWDGDEFGNDPINIYVTAKSLSALSHAGSGSIDVDGELTGENVKLSVAGSGSIHTASKSEDLHVSISGSGSIHLRGSTNTAKISIAGSGQLMAKEFKTGEASVSIAGSGNAYFAAEKNISAHIAGSGSVIYSGSASVSNSHTIGSGRVTKED